jgi:hypothetical protein
MSRLACSRRVARALGLTTLSVFERTLELHVNTAVPSVTVAPIVVG